MLRWYVTVMPGFIADACTHASLWHTTLDDLVLFFSWFNTAFRMAARLLVY